MQFIDQSLVLRSSPRDAMGPNARRSHEGAINEECPTASISAPSNAGLASMNRWFAQAPVTVGGYVTRRDQSWSTRNWSRSSYNTLRLPLLTSNTLQRLSESRWDELRLRAGFSWRAVSLHCIAALHCKWTHPCLLRPRLDLVLLSDA